MKRVFLIEDDVIMAECIVRAMRRAVAEDIEYQIFTDGVAAIQALDTSLPDLICLDILLNGPDGFTFLNELTSYSDTNEVPIIIISSLDLQGQDLSTYNVRAIFQKDTMTPTEVGQRIEEVLADGK